MCKFESGLISNKCKLFLGRVNVCQDRLDRIIHFPLHFTIPRRFALFVIQTNDISFV